ncbi:hypothetical protein PVAND_010353 [Polypedilum vanderplanki]|uniref:Serine/threonine-protein phosphatase PGAM5, mitochondrial n=1 Tax=Polypedilum vanderplanki TaxID=319348 RepID=A0A9J6CGD0_POLVA|nr:hypothetical protein PVAND_010353 [Polypedilum vanderplanki]
MYSKFLKQSATLVCYSCSAVSLAFFVKKEKIRTYCSWTTNIPSIAWDDNWDFRAPTAIIKPLKEGSSPEKENEYNEKLEKLKPKASRHFLLIRHGQYNLNGLTDKERVLTKLGREQAIKTGQRLKELEFPISQFAISTMTRAQETANLIMEQLPEKLKFEKIHDSMLEEGAVCKPDPPIEYWNPEEHEFFTEGARIEAAFRKYIHRADPEQEKDSYTAIVCHGNVIRYFVCRALQLPPQAWLRLGIHHASITWIVVYPSGRVVLRFFGDCGYMPKSHVTQS